MEINGIICLTKKKQLSKQFGVDKILPVEQSVSTT